MIEKLVRIHRRSKKLNKELNALYFSNARVAAIMDAQHKETQQCIVRCLRRWGDCVRIKDVEAAAAVAFILVSGVVHQIVFGGHGIRAERLVHEAVDVLSKYLAGPDPVS